jgi:hypothetical protein
MPNFEICCARVCQIVVGNPCLWALLWFQSFYVLFWCNSSFVLSMTSMVAFDSKVGGSNTLGSLHMSLGVFSTVQ